MNSEAFREFCMTKPGVTEGFPFGGSTLVFKVMNKMFALMDADNFEFTNLKCDPELAIELREQHACVKPGYHMSKKHWNSVYFDGSVGDQLILEWVNHSYELVVSSLSKKDREVFNDMK